MAKYKIRKTGELVDVISWSCLCARDPKHDTVSFVDSKGVEHPREKGLNIYWDFIKISEEEQKKSEIDWEQRRYELVKAAMSSLLSSVSGDRYTLKIKSATIAADAAEYADAVLYVLRNTKLGCCFSSDSFVDASRETEREINALKAELKLI